MRNVPLCGFSGAVLGLFNTVNYPRTFAKMGKKDLAPANAHAEHRGCGTGPLGTRRRIVEHTLGNVVPPPLPPPP